RPDGVERHPGRTDRNRARPAAVGAGIAIAVSGNAQPFLLVLFAWQGLVYASAPIMSWLNVRTVLTPELERRRRTELRRERAAALVPHYVGGTVAAAAIAAIAAVLFLGGKNPGTPPSLQLPHPSGPPGIIGPRQPGETAPAHTPSRARRPGRPPSRRRNRLPPPRSPPRRPAPRRRASRPRDPARPTG
ncbi:MAG TPA: hypothetical protein VHI50_03050, partial [Micromonosporaceae bacterium]|nr:hypothetical protein [Micromonosporaceae bacterium]